MDDQLEARVAEYSGKAVDLPSGLMHLTPIAPGVEMIAIDGEVALHLPGEFQAIGQPWHTHRIGKDYFFWPERAPGCGPTEAQPGGMPLRL